MLNYVDMCCFKLSNRRECSKMLCYVLIKLQAKSHVRTSDMQTKPISICSGFDDQGCLRYSTEMHFCHFYFAELSDKSSWTALDYANKFSKIWKFDDNCERISVRDVDCDEFIERYEKPYKPVVIEDIQVSIDTWKHANTRRTTR